MNNIRSEYLQSKENFLKESDYEEATKELYIKMFKSFVLKLEESKGKDLYDFDKTEIEDTIKYAPTKSERTKRTLFSVISSYREWAMERGFNTTGNPCNSIIINDILNLNKKAIDKGYYKLEDIYEILDKNKDDINYNEGIVMLLARYGLEIKRMPYLKFEDVDRENKLLTIYTSAKRDKILTYLPIDDELIDYIDKTDKETVVITKKRTFEYINTGYILKVMAIDSDYTETDYIDVMLEKTSIYTRYNKIFAKTGIKRISITDLVRSRKLDLLFDIYNNNGILTYDNVREVNKLITGSDSLTSVNNLKKDFELLSGVEVHTRFNRK